MDKRVGSSAGIFALVALLLHTLIPSDAEKPAKTPAKKEAASSPSAGEAGTLAADAEGPWRATQQYFHKLPTASKTLGCQYSYFLDAPKTSCSQEGLLSLLGFEPHSNPANLRFLLATLADPLHTRLSIETDRDLDAIQRAAFRSGWELATQWLPWTARAAESQNKSGDLKRDRMDVERFPGLLVFRRHFEPGSQADQLLLVLVVAETPTAGLNGFQFQVAQRILSVLGQSAGRDVFIAGPRYSGSFLSLTRLLKNWQPAPNHFILQAGNVSNSEYAQAMLSEFPDAASSQLSAGQPPEQSPKPSARQRSVPPTAQIVFHGSSLASASFENHFKRLVKSWNLRDDEAAELIEDETGFSFRKDETGVSFRKDETGVSFRKSDGGIPAYRYPRDIAQVRNNYNDAAFAPASLRTDTTTVPALEFSLKDSQSGEDIFPMFSTSHTPASQNAELQQTIHYLRRKGVRLASLSATNVFDAIFLANLLSQSCPDMRIVLRGPDLLFVQEAAQSSLSGLMAISPFPLFPEGGVWSNGPTSDTTAYASGDQVGEFNAIATLLHEQDESSGGTKLSLPSASGKKSPPERSNTVLQQYAKSADEYPMSAWLLELGPTGWLPIDLLSQTKRPLTEASWTSLNGTAIAGGPSWFAPSTLPATKIDFSTFPVRLRSGWVVLCLACAVFTLAFCGRLIWLYFRPRTLVWSNLCIVDINGDTAARDIRPVVHHRYMCMLCGFSTLVFVNGLLLCPMLAIYVQGNEASNLWVGYVVGIALLVALLIALGLTFFIPFRIRVNRHSTRVAVESFFVRGTVLAIPLLATYRWWRCCYPGTAGYLLCFRTLSLTAPVSPVWPLLISGCGLFALCYFHLRRFTWAYRRQPHLDTSTFGTLLSGEFARLKERLESSLYHPSTFARFAFVPKSLIAALITVGVLSGCTQIYSLNSFEPSGFTKIFEFLQVPLAVFTVISFGRFLNGWNLLRALLVSLNSVELGSFFKRVPEFGGNGPVWIREVKLISLATAVNSLIALRNLGLSGFGQGQAEAYREPLENFLALSGPGLADRLKFIAKFDAFRRRANEISASLGSSVLQPYWTDSHNVLPYVGTISNSDSAETEALSQPSRAPGDTLMTLVAAAAGSGGSVMASPPPVPAASTISEDAYKFASKYIALQYSVFIGYVLLHLQNLLLCSTVCFVFVVIALNSYVFQVPQIYSYFLLAGLTLAAVLGIRSLAQLERDPIISRLSGTPEGMLGKDFYWRAAAYGALPVLSILSTQFPAISRFLSSWVEPAISKLQ